MEAPEPSSALNLDGGWCLGEESFREIKKRLEPLAPRVLLEYGSGASSVRLAQAFPSAKVVSIDHDPNHFAQTRQLRDFYRVENLTVLRRPIRLQMHKLVVCRSYARGPLPDTIDAVIIDGPPGAMLGGREACLYQSFRNLRVGGLVILDDYSRLEEQLARRHWHLRFPDALEGTEVEAGHGLCILTKTRACRPHISVRATASSLRRWAGRARLWWWRRRRPLH